MGWIKLDGVILGMSPFHDLCPRNWNLFQEKQVIDVQDIK